MARPPRHMAARHGAEAGRRARRDRGPPDRRQAHRRRSRRGERRRGRGARQPARARRGRRHAARSATSPTTSPSTSTGTSRTSRTSSRSMVGPRRWSGCSGGPASATRSPTSPPLNIDVDRERARFSAWYEFFPRSTLAPGDRPRHAGRRPRSPRLRRRHGLRRRLPAAGPPDRPHPAQGPQQHGHVVARRHRQPVGDRRRRTAATPPCTPSWARVDDVVKLAVGLPRARTWSWRSTSPSSARPTTRGSPSTLSGSPTGPTARSSTPRTRRRSTRTSTRSTSRATTGRACGRSWPT